MASNVKIRLSAVIGTCLFLGLAIWGWGGFGPFFASPARIALTMVFVALTIAGMLTAANLSTGQREDRGNRWVLAAFGILGILAAYVSAWCDRNDFWVVDGDTVRWIGVALLVPGGIIR